MCEILLSDIEVYCIILLNNAFFVVVYTSLDAVPGNGGSAMGANEHELTRQLGAKVKT